MMWEHHTVPVNPYGMMWQDEAAMVAALLAYHEYHERFVKNRPPEPWHPSPHGPRPGWKMKPRKYYKARDAKIWACRQEGWTLAKIAKRFKISPTRVRQIVMKFALRIVARG